MSCGRPAYVYDAFGGDGWVTADTYDAIEADALAGQAFPDVIDGDRLRKDLAAYDPVMGHVNRTLILKHHQARTHVHAAGRGCSRRSPRGPPARAPVDRGARARPADAAAVAGRPGAGRAAGCLRQARPSGSRPSSSASPARGAEPPRPRPPPPGGAEPACGGPGAPGRGAGRRARGPRGRPRPPRPGAGPRAPGEVRRFCSPAAGSGSARRCGSCPRTARSKP